MTGLRLEPFVATRYANIDPQHLAAVTSPAYDLIPPAQRLRLQDADPRNIVRLILPQQDPSTGDKYACAAAALAQWRTDGTLTVQDAPALFVYEMSEPGSAVPPTVGIIGQIAVLPDADGGVLPHEDVWEPVVVDRAALAAATEANLEPIVLAADVSLRDWPDVEQVRDGTALLDFAGADGVRHRIWAIQDPGCIERVCSTVRSGAAVIADGHHRWASYQRLLREHSTPGAAHALVYLVPVADAGLRVRAIHRILRDRDLSAVLGAASANYDVVDRTEDFSGTDAEANVRTAEQLLRDGEPFTVLLTDGTGWAELRRPDRTAVTAAVGTDHRHNWRHLDIAVAHRLLLNSLLAIADDDHELEPSYDPIVSLRELRAGSGSDLLMMVRSSTPAQVLAVARDGDRMPRKSTLFIPKPRTGLLMRQFAENR